MKLRHLGPLAVAACTAAALLLTPGAADAAGTTHAAGTDSLATAPDTAIGSSAPDALTAAPQVTPATSTPLGTATLHRLATTGAIGDLAVVGANIWISNANQVDVYSPAGKQLATLTGVLGAAGISVSADQSLVYVAASQDSKIITYDAATMVQNTSWTSNPCPTDLAIAGGRLIYSYGCTAAQASIGSVSTSDGSEGPVIAGNMTQPALLAGGGQTLVSMASGTSPTDVASYLIAADGTATTQATLRVENGSSALAISPDGTALIMPSSGPGAQIARFNTADLSVAGTFALSSTAWALAYSPDGSTFTGTLYPGGSDMVRVYDNASGSLSSHSAADPDNTNQSVLPGTLQYSGDGSRVYGVAAVNGVESLLTATARPVAESELAAKVTNPAAYGKSLVFRISAPNRPKAKVSVVVPAYGGSGTRQVSGTTSTAGTATLRVAGQLNGKAVITLPGDLTHSTGTTSRTIKVPAKLSVTPTGYYSSRGGMRHYHTIKSVHVVTQALPKRAMTLKVVLQARIAGRWISRVSDTFTTAADGSGFVYLTKGNKHLPYRIVLSFAGDPDNAKAPSVTSVPLTVD